MTIAEVLLAEKGFNKKLELQANLMLMAHSQAQAKKPKLFDFASKPNKNNGSVKASTLQEREETFKALEGR